MFKTSKTIKSFFQLFLLTLLVGCQEQIPRQKVELKLVNLAHLNSLYEEVVIEDREMAIIHIYSEYPDYNWVDANNEGIACVDDAARAAVVYLRHFEITDDSASLNRGRKLLEFCRFMQDEDGQFYNFIFADHSINKKGKTSFKSLGWWAARGIWAMGEGYRILNRRHPDYAAILEKHIKKTFAHIDTLLAHYPAVENINGFQVPRWLLYNSAADATSELMLGLAAYAEASGDKRVLGYLNKFAEGLIEMQVGSEQSFPYRLFLSWKNIWHGWANGQTQALAIIGDLLNNDQILNAAKSEASTFYPFWMKSGFPREFQFTNNESFMVENSITFDQIAYALRPVVLGSLNLYRVTKDERYAELAGKLATWFFGNNPANRQMYDPKTGRCFDGILSETEINRNAGAESTIEALYSILEVEANAIAAKTLENYRNLQEQ